MTTKRRTPPAAALTPLRMKNLNHKLHAIAREDAEARSCDGLEINYEARRTFRRDAREQHRCNELAAELYALLRACGASQEMLDSAMEVA